MLHAAILRPFLPELFRQRLRQTLLRGSKDSRQSWPGAKDRFRNGCRREPRPGTKFRVANWTASVNCQPAGQAPFWRRNVAQYVLSYTLYHLFRSGTKIEMLVFHISMACP